MSDSNYKMTQSEIAAALNEWMRRYIADPSSFQAEFETVSEFISGGEEPSYGTVNAAYLLKLHNQLNQGA